jgi:hypothetical protein
MTLAGPEPMIDHPQGEYVRRLRRTVALPIYALALLLSFLSDALGDLAAKIAGDDVGG